MAGSRSGLLRPPAASGRLPVNISHNTRPSAYTSVRFVTSRPSSCSGAMYAGRAGELGPIALPVREIRETKIRKVCAALSVDQDIGGLQVTMQYVAARAPPPDPRTAGGLSSTRLVGRQPADAPQQRREVLAVDVFHREEVAGSPVSPMSWTRQTFGCETCRESRTS